MRPASPCISVCVLDSATGLCRGCARTVAEITNWMRYSAVEREAVWRALPERQSLFAAQAAARPVPDPQ